MEIEFGVQNFDAFTQSTYMRPLNQDQTIHISMQLSISFKNKNTKLKI